MRNHVCALNGRQELKLSTCVRKTTAPLANLVRREINCKADGSINMRQIPIRLLTMRNIRAIAIYNKTARARTAL